MEGGFLEEFTSSVGFAAALSIVGIVLAINGGRIAAHRAFHTRFFDVRGGGALALGLVVLVLGLAVVAVAWMRGLGFLR
jgi:hypothetical protein